MCVFVGVVWSFQCNARRDPSPAGFSLGGALNAVAIDSATGSLGRKGNDPNARPRAPDSGRGLCVAAGKNWMASRQL